MTRRTGWSPEEEEEESVDAPEAAEEDGGRSITEVLRLLISEGQDYAATEVERQKLRARIIGAAARDAAILGAVALFLLAGTLVALLVGGIWALAPFVGPIAATCIVIGLCFAVILLLALIARSRIRTALRHAMGRETS